LHIAALWTPNADGADQDAIISSAPTFSARHGLFFLRQDFPGEPERQTGANRQTGQRSLQETTAGEIATFHESAP